MLILFSHFCREHFQKAKAVLVIATENHLKFLRQAPSFSYAPLIQASVNNPWSAPNPIVFYYGIDSEDLQVNDSAGKPIVRRFPDFPTGWIAIKHPQVC